MRKNSNSFLCSLEVGKTRKASCSILTMMCDSLEVLLHSRSYISLYPKMKVLVLTALSLKVILRAMFFMF